MRCFIGLGSSLGDRRAYLESAARELAGLSKAGALRVSPVYETPALMPPEAPASWDTPYLNAVARIEWRGEARELLRALKQIEVRLGRVEAARWAPRTIDLDLLVFGEEIVRGEAIEVPHPRMQERAFVLDPLKDLDAGLRIPGSDGAVTVQARRLKAHTPWIMGIVNVTPDSFSDGGANLAPRDLEATLGRVCDVGAQAVDLGAESTRPGAAPVSAEEERRRLLPALESLASRFRGRFIRPVVSVDTRNASTAAMAIELGATCINDVSGGADPGMLEVLASSECDYVLMHSLTVPADPATTLDEARDPLLELRSWLMARLERLDRAGIDSSRVIFDPGIGFGKSARQSIAILERMRELADLPVRLLVGHSRKSCLKSLGGDDRDATTLAVSLKLADQGVDILRVHDFESHLNAMKKRARELS